VDITFPALVFCQMLATIDAGVLRESRLILLLGALLLLVAGATGWLLRRVFQREAGGGGTFIFLIMIPNWIFLPLPIAEALYGSDGVRTVLLLNVSAQFLLWTLGVWVLRGGIRGAHCARSLILNPGLIATVLGILVALVFPQTRELALNAQHDSWAAALPSVVLQALSMLGSVTIPLSLFVTGAQLGGLARVARYPVRPLAGVLLGRLLLAPLVTALLMVALGAAGLEIPIAVRNVAFIVALMPVAVSCGMFVERYGGDIALTARSISYSTLLSMLTVPTLFFVLQRWLS
jgi:predicted permease